MYVDNELHASESMKKIVEVGDTLMDKVPLIILLEYFVNNSGESSKNSRRSWHPLMLKWCIYLRHQSQSAYETIRQSKCVILPSQRTLCDYMHSSCQLRRNLDFLAKYRQTTINETAKINPAM